MRRLAARGPVASSVMVPSVSLSMAMSSSSSAAAAAPSTSNNNNSSNHNHHNHPSKNPVSTGKGGRLGASVMARMLTGGCSAAAISKMTVDEACSFVAQLQPEAVHMLSGTINDSQRTRTSYLTANNPGEVAHSTVNYFGLGGGDSSAAHKPDLFASEAQQNVYALVCERILIAHEVDEADAITKATKVVLGAFPAFQGRIIEDTVSLYLERFASVAAEEAATEEKTEE